MNTTSEPSKHFRISSEIFEENQQVTAQLDSVDRELALVESAVASKFPEAFSTILQLRTCADNLAMLGCGEHALALAELTMKIQMDLLRHSEKQEPRQPHPRKCAPPTPYSGNVAQRKPR
jgi:hypothetical protein